MAVKPKKKQEEPAAVVQWPYGPKNYLFFGAALLSIVVGYIALAKGSITLAPLLLVIGYCVLIPIALIIKDKSVERRAAETTTSPE